MIKKNTKIKRNTQHTKKYTYCFYLYDVKNIIAIVLLLFCVNLAFAQHEGIERHFNSYTICNTASEDYTYYNDTLTDNFHNFLPQQKITYNPLGFINPGTPFIPSIYSEKQTHSCWFFDNYTPYIQQHDNIIYFDAKKPFTLFNFTGGSKDVGKPYGQEIVKFLHTQNITPTFNFAFNYDIIKSYGRYQSNIARANAISIATAYTKRKYESHANFIYNKINHLENGGLQDISLFQNTKYRSNEYSVNLENAQTTIGQLGLQYNQELKIGSYSIDTIILGKDTALNKTVNSKFSIIHDLKADKYYRIYQDIPSSFYQNIYRDSTHTFDSSYYKVLDNTVLLNFLLEGNGKIDKFQLMAGIKNYLYNYGYDSTSTTYLSNYITGNLSFDTEKSIFYASVSYCIAGTDIFDTEISANLNQKITENSSIDAYFGFSLLNPSIFLYSYKSNHFQWEIDANKTSTISGGINLNLAKYNFDIGSNFNILDNYFIFDTDAMPAQVAAANIIADAYVSKQFQFGIFTWLTKFTYQYISDRNRLPLPAFIGYSSLYLKKSVFKNAMQLQLGFDVKYHSSIYGYAYMPATGVFYLQNNSKFGSYPNAGIFGVVKIKRLRGFVKLSNFNSYFMPRDYLLLYKIPDNPFSFNFGISWEFYD